MINKVLISIITPFYNSSDYLYKCINSVLSQTHENWELILINDGSLDSSKDIAMKFQDSRIHYFEQENQGVSVARNVGLAKMKGEFFCFLDADDALSINSLSSRLEKFKTDSNLNFVDGQVQLMDEEMKIVNRIWQPSFIGNPLKDLVHQTGRSFLGQTWMIKRNPNQHYQFNEELTHAEDLLFYLNLAKDGGNYSFVNEPILKYRNTPDSAMKNLEGLHKGYKYIENEIKDWKELSILDLFIYGYKYRKAMFLSYLSHSRYYKAIRTLV